MNRHVLETGSSKGSNGSGDGAGGLLLSRPRPTSQDQVRCFSWLHTFDLDHTEVCTPEL